jgi:hypothetical protein
MDRQLLARATEGTDAPTPGYIYVDLAKSATANPAAAQEMANYLIKRLSSKQNPNIKWKCCKVISKLCDQVPRNQFRRCLSNNPASTAAIKEAMAFRGAPDAVRGDAPNERVRVAAKEALDAVYSESSSSEMANHGGGGGGGMGISSSYAPSPYAQSGGGGGGGMGGGGGGGARRMEGIGGPQNSAYNPGGGGHQQQHGHHPNAHLKAVVQEAGSVLVSMIKDPLARNVTSQDTPRQGHSGNLPGYGGPTVRRLWNNSILYSCPCSMIRFITFFIHFDLCMCMHACAWSTNKKSIAHSLSCPCMQCKSIQYSTDALLPAPRSL